MASTVDLEALRSFMAVADTGGFTRAGERLGRAQSAISLHVRRLEAQLGQRLFVRDSRHVRLTPAGEQVLARARAMLRLNDELVEALREPDLAGAVRLGTPEDFATAHLPGVLSAFAAAHPRVALEVTCDLTLNLMERFAAGEFDLVLVKREPAGPSLGVRVWRERLVWAGLAGGSLPGGALPAGAVGGGAPEDEAPVPLVVSPHPCVYRRRALSALDQSGRRWRIAYTSTSLAGAQAAVRARLGLTVLPRDMVPGDFAVLGPGAGLPPLEDTEMALVMAPGTPSRPARRLAEHITQSLERPAASSPG